MNKLQMAQPIGDGARPRFVTKVLRPGRPPAPWTWAIYKEDREVPCQVSRLAYRSADEAWEAAHIMLDRIERSRRKAAVEPHYGAPRSVGRSSS
jgi:hypothetical protein